MNQCTLNALSLGAFHFKALHQHMFYAFCAVRTFALIILVIIWLGMQLRITVHGQDLKMLVTAQAFSR